ncbi:hypothetical protein OMAG_002423 [Candidatus Omnitrophus magneticus]|uniref:Uncharacterized protein n=1 Tax=Candidatus Omnitrophus magneticus TaxID=1609969 RepID=A0A0F0CKE9_9BACT|nr:hypothetical protein OMAG_002423 [Candidatus Omnitrophus magneticus]
MTKNFPIFSKLGHKTIIFVIITAIKIRITPARNTVFLKIEGICLRGLTGLTIAS